MGVYYRPRGRCRTETPLTLDAGSVILNSEANSKIMAAHYLFNRVSIFDVIENQKRRVAEAIQTLDANYLLNASEEDLVRALVEEHRLDVPAIKDNEIHVADYGETTVDVSQDPMRFISD